MRHSKDDSSKPGTTERACWGCGEPITDPPLSRGKWSRYHGDECKALNLKRRTRILKPGEPTPDGPPRRYVNTRGYIRLRWTTEAGEVETYEHRVVDGFVTEAEHVHHRNHDRSDNRPENLDLMTADDHAREHADHRRIVDPDAAVEMYASGMTQVEIAEALGCHSSAVSRAMKGSGVAIRRSGRPMPSEDAVRAAYEASTSAVDMAHRLGESVPRTRVAMKRAGLASFPPGRPKNA